MTDDDDDATEDAHIVVETTVVEGVRQVRIYASTIQHVIERHPEIPVELPVIQEAVVRTIRDPTKVEDSYNNSLVFIDEESTNASGDPLSVSVRVVDGTGARMKSFYFASSEKPRPVIYKRGDNDAAQ